jgi:hypothetical protein
MTWIAFRNIKNILQVANHICQLDFEATILKKQLNRHEIHSFSVLHQTIIFIQI